MNTIVLSCVNEVNEMRDLQQTRVLVILELTSARHPSLVATFPRTRVECKRNRPRLGAVAHYRMK